MEDTTNIFSPRNQGIKKKKKEREGEGEREEKQLCLSTVKGIGDMPSPSQYKEDVWEGGDDR